MKSRKIWMAGVLLVAGLGFGATRGLAHMQRQYYGVCSNLSGFPGLLQKMNFFTQGDCPVQTGTKGICQNNSTCHVDSRTGSKTGRCQTITIRNTTSCTCVLD